MSKHENNIAAGAAALLAPGEDIVSTLVVSPRGSSTAAAPGLAPAEIGRPGVIGTEKRPGRSASSSSASSGLALTAAGSTDREIAQALFVTEKTVETHLGRAFRKLDVSSRRQLPDVLARAAG